ncbi:hypothetical protein BO99DRAFT_398588 [Aspergillus violaceofuscus CBS 115571]|uniref:Uncharacterized protein n=1 Tax=Aspergillus violaceofuscus (strain CBS 115571) TaxID=1450538 RepID=A0A2V5HPK1_ASPV1|nr:hypothetical protein BO99DRAFT_398588 [Aspergillus violaceofuscus CBS 115571]
MPPTSRDHHPSHSPTNLYNPNAVQHIQQKRQMSQKSWIHPHPTPPKPQPTPP